MFYPTLPQDTQDFGQVLSGVGRSLREIGRSTQYLPYDVLGAPVDLATLALRPMGYTTERPVGGSDWLIELARQYGLADRPTGSGIETATRLATGITSPTAVPRAVGKFAQGLERASDITTEQANRAADALVRQITGNPTATAPQVLEATSMPFMQAVAPRASNVISPELDLQMAKEAAERIGLSPNREVRMRELGYDTGWYHGTTGDVEKFRLDLLGEATGAESAKKGFFFARDPIDPPKDAIVEKGSGARTASGYSMIGGDREYRDAMRKAAVAEKNQNWDEYEKQMQIAENFAISRLNKSQELVAKYGDARDVMTDKVQNAFYNKKLTQQEAEELDVKFRELMPYGWYNQFNKEQFDVLKSEIKKIAPEKLSNDATKAIDDFIKIKNERALDEQTQSGSNVIPAALRYKNPLVYDFKGSAYRDTTYAELVEKARQQGNDAVILKNTYDPGAGKAELVDVGVVFEPSQIRSRFAAFDPTRTKEGSILAGAFPIGLLGDENE